MKSAASREEQMNEIAMSLRMGRRVSDFKFDQVYPTTLRRLSRVHWTPVEVGIRVAELLGPDESANVLDIGSGCGKFCIVGALTSPAHFTGVEERRDLFTAAEKVKRELSVERVLFIHQNMDQLDWSKFNSFYLFNPFYENMEKSIRIDTAVSHNSDKYYGYIETVRKKLGSVAAGSRVVTYHGFGGNLPDDFKLKSKEPIGTSVVELWVKT